MVKPLTPIKSEHFLKRELFLAITIFVVVFSFSANFVSAAKMKINEQGVERVKVALDIVKTASNFGGILVDGGGLKTILNTAIRGGQTATDVTYGLLVLSAINEMELMDLVLSQDYKEKERAYFGQILDERTSLTSYWKGVGFDIPRVVSGQMTGPIGALTLNTFEFTDKAILILTEFEVLKKGKLYDGLWRYFDERMNGESHQGAWELAEPQMGFAVNSIGFRRNTERAKDKAELEQQFAALYEKWGPYATAYGISKEYKERLASELRNTLAAAIKENTEARPLYVKEPSLWEKFSAQLASIKNAVANIVSQTNPFKAGPLVELPAEIPAENGSPQIGKAADVGFPPALNEEATTTTEPVDTEPAEIIEATSTESPPVSTTTEPVAVEPELLNSVEDGLPQTEEIELCQRGAGGAARQYRVLINEVAWMGSQESSNDEWIELKNIWGIPVNLAGWQLQDKDRQIKIIFGENDILPVQDYLLLERTKDYTGALNNSDEALYLFDNNCQLEDEIVASPNWPGGDNAMKKPIQRFDVLSWYTGSATAGKENSLAPAVLASPSAPAQTPASAPSSLVYPKILITESRLGSPGNQKDDFVELYNPNSEAVGLADWYIQKKTATGQDFSSYAPASLFSGKTIGAKGYFLVANASSSLSVELIDASTTYALTENNTLAFKNPNQDIVDQVSTGNPAVNKSFSRKWSSSTASYIDTDSVGDFEVQDPTPRAQNLSSAEEGEGGGETQALSVVINEIAWMGTAAKSQDEWVEFYNNTTSSINLTDWRLVADDGGPDITFSTSTIPAGGYFLVERTDDNTVSNIFADWSSSFSSGLSNNGENLELYDNLGNLIDSVDFSSSWPAGQGLPNYISMERINSTSTATSTNWAGNNRLTRNGLDADNNSINGTPKAQNSVSKSSTEINNGIIFDENITLTYLGSPYIINSGTLEVEPGVVLTIEPGTVIKFNSGTKMLVYGTLLAQGNAGNRIIFTSNTDSDPENNGGYYIYFEPSSQNSVLNNIAVRYGGFYVNDVVGYKAALSIEDALLTLTDSVIENNFFAGVYLMNSDSTIQNTIFRDNKVKYSDWGSGSYSRGLSVYNSAPNLSGLYFERNYRGVYVEGDCPDLSDVVFGTSTDANTFDVSPGSCEP